MGRATDDDFGTEFLDLDSFAAGRDSSSVTHVRDEWQMSPRVHATIGADYQRVSYRDLSADRRIDVDEVNPRLGMSVRLSPTTVVRAAAFRQLSTNFFGDFIAPAFTPINVRDSHHRIHEDE